MVMDNLQVHKMRMVRDLLEGHGCSLVFLPSYGADFNPIEEAFSEVMTLLRKVKARSLEALIIASERALSAVYEEDARGFFQHRGYKISRALSL
jgi:transposase